MRKRIISIVALVFVFVMLFSVPVAAKSYQTYTYSLNGFALYSPDAYVPEGNTSIDSAYMGLDDSTSLKKALKNPKDIEVDNKGNVYIADAGDAEYGRIIVLDRYYKLKFVIRDFVNDQGKEDALSRPQGVYITDDTIFVCDTGNSRIVTFDRKGNFKSVIKEPESELFESESTYSPIAIAVDDFNRLYVVSDSNYQGIIVMTITGQFTGFIGAQKVSLSAWEILWRRFQTEEQKKLTSKSIPTAFNNITITDDGFIYITTSSISSDKQQSAVSSRSTSGAYAPVKLLNAAGEEIMRRNGFWPPSGEVAINKSSTDKNAPTGASKIVDVAVGPEKTWTIIDQKRAKAYTYDFDGNLLFIFGDIGDQIGNMKAKSSSSETGLLGVTYQDDKMLLLDNEAKCFTVYRRTKYGDILIQALSHQNKRQYDVAVEDWTEILKRNANYDAAYIGIGQSLYRSGQYDESITYFKAAYDTANYEQSYKEIRKDWISKWLLLIPLGLAVIAVGWIFFMKYCNKVNTRAAVAGGKRNFKEEMIYAIHVIFHPFDGFWDLKHEKRGSLRAAIVYMLLAVLAYFYQAVGSGYAVNQQIVYTTIIEQAISVLLPIFLFAVANWCLTTLFEGEGSFKDIVIALGYSMLPLILTIVPTTIASNFLTGPTEVQIIEFINMIGLIWLGILVFLGMMVTHDYSMWKNILTTLGTVIGMVFIMFIGILFTTLLGKLVSFVTNIITELNYRA